MMCSRAALINECSIVGGVTNCRFSHLIAPRSMRMFSGKRSEMVGLVGVTTAMQRDEDVRE